jgi:hypothetical protein
MKTGGETPFPTELVQSLNMYEGLGAKPPGAAKLVKLVNIVFFYLVF